MQNNILKQDLLDNTVDSFVVINPTKQQLAFFPKEESQMFTSKTKDNTGAIPTSSYNDSTTESVNNDTHAFTNRVQKITQASDVDFEGYGVPPAEATTISGSYVYNIPNLNSSHTDTDYIGATTFTVPTILSDLYSDFKLFNLQTAVFTDLYAVDDTVQRIKNVMKGMQTLRIPKDKFNTILTDEAAIIANNNSNLVKNFGKYYLTVSPKYVRTTVGNIIERRHIDYWDMFSNGNMSYDSLQQVLKIEPDFKRRNVYECDKTDFEDLTWAFETSPKQSGRLYGSVVEVWDASEEILKQVKIMTENEFNFSNSSAMRFVVYPDNVGYDAPTQEITTGDVLHVFPRETYFNQIVVEVTYKDSSLQLENLIAFMLNDTVRDMKTGIYEIYDNNGFTIDTAGNFTGNVANRFQIFQYGQWEARKRIKNG